MIDRMHTVTWFLHIDKHLLQHVKFNDNSTRIKFDFHKNLHALFDACLVFFCKQEILWESSLIQINFLTRIFVKRE